ncbi:MAG: hypothetical protein E7251_16480 [Paenibacillaceae bacterium]|nr:hypothetical protein [Paenibacillaceae bacterium]
MTRRIISIFLIICMVVGLTPISVVAEEGNPGQTSESFTTQNEDYESATPSEAEEEPETEEPQTEVPQETTAQPEQLTEPEVITEPAAMPFDFEAATPAQALTAGVDPEIEYLAPDTFAFNAADEGYSFIAPLQIRINNIGETSTGTLDIVLTGSGKDDYSITKTSLPSIGAGQSDYFNVSPKTGLTTGDYTATVTVWANGVELKSTDLSFTVTPAGAKYPVEIRTYIDNIPSDMDGVVVLRNNQTTVEASKTDTGIYKTTAANGTYDIYVDGVDTNKIIAISNGATIVEIDYYTVSFSTSYAGTATGSSINATAGGTSIANGTKVVKGTPVTITATGAGAASYTYAWSGDGTNSQTTQSLTVASLSGTINAVCAVTGVGVMPSDPDYKIGNNPYLWTGSDQTIVLSGNNETLSILKPPSAVIRIDVRSEDLSTVTIEGNSIPCDKTYIEVYNDITLNLVDLTITAPDKTGVESSAVMLNKDDSESDQMKINVSGICNLTGSNWGSGIRSIHDQDLLISGSGTLNVTGGSTTDSNLAGGLGIDMEGYTYAMNQGARLTIDGGVTVNATGGSGQSNNGGTGIRVSWGSIRIGDADITATGGDSSSANYWGPGFGIQASFPSNDHSKGGIITIEDGTVTATGGNSDNTNAGRGIDAFNQLNITGGTVTATGGDSKKALGGTAIYAYEQEFNVSGGTVTATGGDSEENTAGSAVYTYLKNINITGGSVTATGGDGKSNSSLGLYSYLGDINITQAEVTVKGGNGEVNGSHAVYTHYGSINIGDGADVTAIGGNGTTGVGGVGLRAYGSSDGSDPNRGTVRISEDAGDIYIRGGRGASAYRDSVMGRNIYISTGNIELISMESGSARTIMNAEGGDNVYRMKASVDPAAETVITSEVNGTPGRYTYRAVTKDDGVAYLWLPSGSQTVSSSGYASKSADIAGNDGSVKEVTLTKIPTMTVPGAPLNVSAVAGDRNAVVSFNPPLNNGGSSIQSYIVISSPGGVVSSGSSSPITVTGLTNGVSYTFTVKAVNSAGTGPASAPSAPVTPKAVVAGTYKVSGKVVEENGNPVPGANLILKKGNREMGTASTDASGNFIIDGIPNDTYNLMVTKESKVVTVLVVVDNEDYVLSEPIKMPSGTTNSIVEVKTGAPDIVVGNLEEQFTQEDKDFAQISGNKVEIKLVANLINKEEIKDDADKISNAAGGNTIGLYLDLSAYKTRTENSIPGTPQRLGVLPDIIEIVLPMPEKLKGKSGITVHRVHDGIPQTLQNGSPDENGEYFVAATDTITIYTKSFSTYTISYTESGTGGSAGSDSSSETSKAVCSRWPGQPVMGREDIPVTHTEKGEAYAAITEKAVLDAATRAWEEAKAKGKTANGIGISLTVKDLGDQKVVGFVIPQYILKILTEKYIRQFELRSGMIALNLDLEALRNLRVQSTGDVTITMAPETRRSGNAQTIIMNRPVYRVTAGYNKDGNRMEIKSIGNGSAIYSIPYTPDKEESGYLYAVSVDEQGNATRITNSAYDVNTNSIIFTSNQFQAGGVGYTQGNRFTDISTHWAKEAMDYMDGRGLITGTSNTVFSPDNNITRGMLATALGRLANVDPGLYQANSFTDVSSDSNAASYADWANKKGIIKASGNGQFLPDQPVTREEMALILQNYTKAVMSCPLSITRDAINYDDNASIDSVYKKAVTSMQQAGVIMGEKNNNFNPKNNVTRAQASMMLYRLAKLTIDPSSEQGWASNDGGQYLYYKDGKAFTGWLDTNGKKYYFYADGILATGTRIDGHDVDENGVMKTE